MDFSHPDFITSLIPHRPPFLWLDRVTALSEQAVVAETVIAEELDLLKGHYPDYPIVPGVLLCEAVFQAGALLIASRLSDSSTDDISGVPVLTRIQGAKFKREVGPGDTIEIRAEMKEKVGQAWFLKGSVRLAGKVAVKVDFSCAVKEGT